jgi:hypothetical protein
MSLTMSVVVLAVNAVLGVTKAKTLLLRYRDAVVAFYAAGVAISALS